MRISLIYPLLSKSRAIVDENKQFWPPLGLAYIAALLEKYGHQVSIIDRDVLLRKNEMDFEKTDELTLEQINSFQTDIIGISATTPNMLDVCHISKLLKQNNSSRKIVLGGPHATAEPILTLQESPDIDAIVRGEGEFTTLDLVSGKDWSAISGITFRDNHQFISTPQRQPCPDIDQLPLPARHLLDMEFYSRPSRFTSRNLSLRTTSLFTARGCPYRCSFCAGPLIFKGKVRFHSPQRVIQEIEDLIAKFRIEAIYFAEDMFLSNRLRAEEILLLFKKHGLHRKIKWFAQLRVNAVDEKLLDLMKETGCVGAEYGFESGSQRILDLMNKRTTVALNLKAAHLTKKAGLRFQANIIVGYPGETEEDFRKTISFIKKIRPNSIGFNIFMPLPGTAIYQKIKQEGKPIPPWAQIGDPEAPQINYAQMPQNRFEQLYFQARFQVILPLKLYFFIKENMFYPWRLLSLAATQFKGVIIKNFRALLKLRHLRKVNQENRL